MISAIDRMIKGDFKKVNSFVTNTCNLKRAVWNIIQHDLRFRHVFFVSCDSHNLQLLIKNILKLSKLDAMFKKALKCVNSLRKVKRQFDLLRKHQKNQYDKYKALIAFTILRWNTQINLLQSLINNKNALQIYAWNDDAGFKTSVYKFVNRTIDYLRNFDFW